MAAEVRRRRGRATSRSLVGALVGAAVLGGCAATPASPVTTAGGPTTTASTAPTAPPVTTEPVTTTTWPASFRVGIRTVTLVDRTRSTDDYATSPPSVLATSRVIATQIRYPTLSTGAGVEQLGAAPATGFGPFPVIVFAHGYAVMPNTYQYLLDDWVRAGFVVVSPIFPVSNYYEWLRQGGGHAPEDDVGNQPADVAFVVGQLAQIDSRSGAFFHGLFDLGRLGLAGQSDGATTVGGLVFAGYWHGYFDAMPAHPLAVALLSGAEFQTAGGYADPSSHPAVLSIESDDDYCNPTPNATQLYSAVAPGARAHWFMTLQGAPHLGPYVGEMPWAAAVATVTTDFFELELRTRHDSATALALRRAGDVAGVSDMTDATAVNLPPTEADGVCGTPTPDDPYLAG